MALTLDSRFMSFRLRFDPILRLISGCYFDLTDGTHEEFDFNHFGELSRVDRLDDWDLLGSIYHVHGAFRDADGNPVAVTIEGTPFRATTLDDLGAFGEDFANPFVVAFSSQGGIVGLGPRYFRALAWQQAATKPAPPLADWYDPEGAGFAAGGLGAWVRTRAAAVSADSTDPVWFAEDAVSIDAENARVYNGWDVLAEFDVEYSADNMSWHAAQEDGDRFFGFLTPDGTRRVVEIANGPNVEWTRIYEGTPYLAGGSSVSASWGSTVDLDQFERLRFTFRPFGAWSSNGIQLNVGGEVPIIVRRPLLGWRGTTVEDDEDHPHVTWSWWFDDVVGGALIAQDAGSLADLALPAATVRSGSVDDARLPPARLAGKLKFIAEILTSLNRIIGMRLYGFVGSSRYERFELTIDGATF